MRRWQYFLRPRPVRLSSLKPLPSGDDQPGEILGEEWLAELFDAKRVEVWEKDDGDFLVCVEYYPSDLPYGVDYLQIPLSGKTVRKYGLVDCLAALASHLRDVKRNYQAWKREFLPEEY